MKLVERKDHLQYEFLPAALEIAETPPSPFGRIVIWLIFVILMAALIWSYFGKVDEVAIARGKVIPDGKLKVVQPLEEGIVTAINVSEGQRVKAGQPLIELDSTMKKVDVEGLEKEIDTIKLENDLLKNKYSDQDIKSLGLRSGLSEEEKMNLVNLNQSTETANKVKQESLKFVILQNEAEVKLGQAEIEKSEQSLPMLKEKENIYKKLLDSGGVEENNLKKLSHTIEVLKSDEQTYKNLFDNGAVSKKEWQDKYNEYISAMKEYDTQKAKVIEEKSNLTLNLKNIRDEVTLTQAELQNQKIKVEQAKSKLEESKRNLENLEKEEDATLYNQIVEKDKKNTELNTELTKAKKSVQFQTLTSPVDGTIHGLVSNTIGGVVTPAQAIMTVVPNGTPLVIEASLLNKDVGFVAVNQEVEIKFDTFPFQKYGTVKGKVLSISPDTFDDQKLGPVYKMKIAMERTIIHVDGKQVHLSPGMTVTAEIKTGKRRIIEFFLDPIIKYTEESLKLR